MSSRRAEGLSLAKRASIYLFQTDPEFVVGGCSDISEILSEWLKRKGYQAEAVYGAARYGKKGSWFLHAWMEIEGARFDPVLWVQNRKMSKYTYEIEPKAAEALKCDVEMIVEGSVEELDKRIR